MGASWRAGDGRIMSHVDRDMAVVRAALDDLTSSTTPTALVAFRLGGVDLRFHSVADVAAPLRESPLEMTDQYRCIVSPDLQRVDTGLVKPTAASVAHERRGYLFTGVSGSGKSTLSANSGASSSTTRARISRSRSTARASMARPSTAP